MSQAWFFIAIVPAHLPKVCLRRPFLISVVHWWGITSVAHNFHNKENQYNVAVLMHIEYVKYIHIFPPYTCALVICILLRWIHNYSY